MPVTSSPATTETLDGATVARAFAAASQHLREHAKAIDAINVYPVPDGDTGSNMSATLREGIERTRALEADVPVAEVLSAIAKGTLYGARGNSGVILSQALRGFAAGVAGSRRLDAAGLVAGLSEASGAAYRAVSKPQEGTMLTVLRAAAEGAEQASKTLPDLGRDSGCATVLQAAVKVAERAEAATMDQLRALREAGVPDAGGEGVCVILRGLLAALTGEVADPPIHTADRPIVFTDGHAEDGFGFCAEFLLERDGRPLQVEAIRALVEGLRAESVMVVGDEMLVRVHAHSETPDQLLDEAAKLGNISRVKVEDMSAQHRRFRASGSGAGTKLGLLALSRGDGFDQIFESLGAVVSDLGLVEKPPAGEIAEAADALRVPDVVVLANHRNVILAAELAASLTTCTLQVVRTRSLPEGIAAALAFDREEPGSTNIPLMERAASQVRTVEVTTAGASRTTEGIAVVEGDAIVLLDGTLVAAGGAPGDMLLAGIARIAPTRGALITIYAGLEVDDADLQSAATAARTRWPAVEVEALRGGQPLYQFVASVE